MKASTSGANNHYQLCRAGSRQMRAGGNAMSITGSEVIHRAATITGQPAQPGRLRFGDTRPPGSRLGSPSPAPPAPAAGDAETSRDAGPLSSSAAWRAHSERTVWHASHYFVHGLTRP